jgi:hypothetical protein
MPFITGGTLAAGGVELAGRTGARPDGDPDVQRETCPRQTGKSWFADPCVAPLFFVNVEPTVDVAHHLLVDKNQRDETCTSLPAGQTRSPGDSRPDGMLLSSGAKTMPARKVTTNHTAMIQLSNPRVADQ